MPRPCKCRQIKGAPGAIYFKPRAVPLCELEEVALAMDEFEALRLADLEGLYQQEAAERMGGGTLAALERLVRELWGAEEAMTVRFLEVTARTLHFDVTRCRYAELYERLGMRELGFCLSCSRDEAFARAFNPRLTLRRTRTIMQGAPLCDFRFELE